MGVVNYIPTAKAGGRYVWGQRHVDDRVVAILNRQLSAADKSQLLSDLKYAPAWIATVIRRLAVLEAEAVNDFRRSSQGTQARNCNPPR